MLSSRSLPAVSGHGMGAHWGRSAFEQGVLPNLLTFATKECAIVYLPGLTFCRVRASSGQWFCMLMATRNHCRCSLPCDDGAVFLTACVGLMASPCGRLGHGESCLGSRFIAKRGRAAGWRLQTMRLRSCGSRPAYGRAPLRLVGAPGGPP